MEEIAIEQRAGVLTITMDRPLKKNALTQAMYQSMADAVTGACKNKDLKVIILTGRQDLFTSGNDLEDFMKVSSGLKDSSVYAFLKAIATCDLPLLAAVEGVAVGVGATLLLHCERVFAGQDSTFSFPFINLGLVAEAGSTQLLPHLTGYQNAADLLLTGDTVSLERAASLGLVSEQTTPGGALEAATAYALKLAGKPRATLVAMKKLLRRDTEPLMARLDHELDIFSEKLQGPEVREAVTAFFEKRAPDFSKL